MRRPLRGLRLALLAALLVGATGISSLSFSSAAKAQAHAVEADPHPAADTLEVALFAGGAAAYGWLANKTYDLGREVGRWLAGSKAPPTERSLIDESADYLLD